MVWMKYWLLPHLNQARGTGRWHTGIKRPDENQGEIWAEQNLPKLKNKKELKFGRTKDNLENLSLFLLMGIQISRLPTGPVHAVTDKHCHCPLKLFHTKVLANPHRILQIRSVLFQPVFFNVSLSTHKNKESSSKQQNRAFLG